MPYNEIWNDWGMCTYVSIYIYIYICTPESTIWDTKPDMDTA